MRGEQTRGPWPGQRGQSAWGWTPEGNTRRIQLTHALLPPALHTPAPTTITMVTVEEASL